MEKVRTCAFALDLNGTKINTFLAHKNIHKKIVLVKDYALGMQFAQQNTTMYISN